MPSAPLASDRLDVVGQFDIGGENNVAAVARGGFGFAQFGELFRDLERRRVSISPYAATVSGVGLTMRRPLMPSSSACVTGFKTIGHVVQPTIAGMSMRPRHDGSVRGAAAQDRWRSREPAPYSSSRCRKVSDYARPECAARSGEKGFGRFAQQIPDDAPGHVMDIECALAQVGIVDLA